MANNSDRRNNREDGSILAVHSGALGDVILFGRLLERFSSRKILVAGGEKARLLAGLGVVDEPMDFDSLPMQEIFTDTPAEKCRLPEKLSRCDLLVSCFASDGGEAGERLKKICGASEAIFLPTRPPADFSGHLLDYWAGQTGLPAQIAYSGWPVPQDWKTSAAKLLQGVGVGDVDRFIVIHPGSGGREKCWPRENFEALARQIESTGQAGLMRTVWIFGEVEIDRWGREAIDSLGRKFPAIICPSLADLAGLLALASGYVGNDSGVSHLSAALGCPTVAIFGPSNPIHFRPLGPKVEVIGGNITIDNNMPMDVIKRLTGTDNFIIW